MLSVGALEAPTGLASLKNIFEDSKGDYYTRPAPSPTKHLYRIIEIIDLTYIGLGPILRPSDHRDPRRMPCSINCRIFPTRPTPSSPIFPRRRWTSIMGSIIEPTSTKLDELIAGTAVRDLTLEEIIRQASAGHLQQRRRPADHGLDRVAPLGEVHPRKDCGSDRYREPAP